MKKNKIMCGLVCVFALLLASFALADVEVTDGLTEGKIVVDVENDETWIGTKEFTFKNTVDCDVECGSACSDCEACIADPEGLCLGVCFVGEDPDTECINCMLTNYPDECTDCIGCHTACDVDETVTLEAVVLEDYTAVLSETEPFDLSPGETKTVTLTLTVSIDEDSGSHDVGDLEWTVDGEDQTPIDIEVNVLPWEEPAEIVVTSGLTVDGKVVVEVDYGVLGEDDDNTETWTYERKLTFENLGGLPGDVSLERYLDVSAVDYAVEFKETGSESFTLDGGDSKTVTLQITVPIDEDSGVHEVGTLDVDGVEGFTDEDTVAIETNVESMLAIEELEVTIDDDSEELDDGDKTEEIAPGMEVELTLKYENLFDNDYDDGDLDEVELTVELADLEDDAKDFFGDKDDELDIEENCDDVDAGDDDGEITVSFDIPTEADEDSYELLIRLEGEDENGAKHIEEWTITLDVDREKDDVRIERAELTMSTVVSGGETSLSIKLENYGSEDQDDVSLTIFNEALGINIQEMDLELDESTDDDNYYRNSFLISVSEDVLAGTFTIEVRVFIDGDEYVDRRLVTLTVVGDAEEPVEDDVVEDEEESDDEVFVQTFDGEETTGMTGGTVVDTVETTQSKGMTGFMIVVVVLLVILIALMLGVLLKR